MKAIFSPKQIAQGLRHFSKEPPKYKKVLKDPGVQKHFLNELAVKLQIKTIDDWYNVSKEGFNFFFC